MIYLRILIMGLNTIIDTYFHGKFLLTSYNFLLYNVFHNVGVHYGTNPWYWFLSEGFPTLLFAHLILFACGLKAWNKLLFPLLALIFNVIFYR